MRSLTRFLMASAVAGLPWLAGCSSLGGSDSSSSRDYDRDYSTSRSDDRYDTYGRSSRGTDYDRASQAGYGSGRDPWRDEDGNLHHPPGWKAASDRGRLPNDRDDRNDGSDRTYDRY